MELIIIMFISIRSINESRCLERIRLAKVSRELSKSYLCFQTALYLAKVTFKVRIVKFQLVCYYVPYS